MNVGSLLYLFRKYHNKTSLDLSNELNISVEEYNALEARDIIDRNLADNLSKTYNVPFEIFFLDQTSESRNFKFSGSPFTSSNGYVHNLYQQDLRIVDLIIQSKDDSISLLKDEIIRLREQNKTLIEQILML